ncbi:MAG: hypothetical protein KBC47_02975 [Candidatus Peribacteraceae bacterium]|nr:hypothetical protein [Candidatus Peribacteraceae bacterium]
MSLFAAPSAGLETVDTREQAFISRERWVITFLLALAITAFQVIFTLYWADAGADVVGKYYSLNTYDSEWYAHIVNHGYMLTTLPLEAEGNTMAHVGFFPGYPIASWILRSITGFNTELSLLATAQIFTVGVWTYILLFLHRYRVRRKLQAVAVVTILAFPSAFFFVTGYSESLFTFTLLGYLYWMTDDHPMAWIPAALHGFVMSATRIVGLPLLMLPFVRHWLRTRKIPADLPPYIVALCTGLGASLFFLYCQGAFGDWNIYSHAQSHGWSVDPKFGAVFDPATYKLIMPATSWDGFVDPNDVSRLSVPIIFALTIVVLLGEIVALLRHPRDPSRFDHIILLAAVCCMFFVTVSGLYTLGMRSVIRYMLPPFILLTIVASSMILEFTFWNRWSARVVWALFSVAIALMFFVQAGHIDLHSHGIWVA